MQQGKVDAKKHPDQQAHTDKHKTNTHIHTQTNMQQDKVDADLKDLRKRHGSLASEAAKYARQKAAAEGAAAAAEQKAKDLVSLLVLLQMLV